MTILGFRRIQWIYLLFHLVPLETSSTIFLEFASKWFTLNSMPLAHHTLHIIQEIKLVGSNLSNLWFNTICCYSTSILFFQSSNTKVYWCSTPTKLYLTYTNIHSTCTIFLLFLAPIEFHSPSTDLFLACIDFLARLGRHFSYFIFF